MYYTVKEVKFFKKKIILNEFEREEMVANLLFASIISTQWKL